MAHIDSVGLVDHHAHGVLPYSPAEEEFRQLATESDWAAPAGTDHLDSPIGLAIRRLCAPAIGLERNAPIQEYIERRCSMTVDDLHTALILPTGTARLLIDSGLESSPVMKPAEMEAALGIPADEIVRLEKIAEMVAPGATAATFADLFGDALRVAAAGAVGFKSIIAYRWGLQLADRAPTAAEVERAAGEWLRDCEANGRFRIDHPILLQHLIWTALPYRMPIQFHVGFGDSDVAQYRADPTRLTGFLVATVDSGASFTLLHCYPFVREASILATVFPHVYLDVGVTTHFLGPSVRTTVRQSVELAPFGKLMYSSDAYGLPEFYCISAHMWRREIGRVLDEWVQDDWLTPSDRDRFVGDFAAENAVRLYGLEPVRV